MEEVHVISKFRHYNYEMGLSTWSTFHIIRLMFKLAMHSGDVTIRKLCSNICPDMFVVEGVRRKKTYRIIKHKLSAREISRIATYGFVPAGDKREWLQLSDFLGREFKKSVTTFLVGFTEHARTLLKNESFGWLILNSHGHETEFIEDMLLQGFKGTYGATRAVNITYSTRFSSAIARGLLTLTDEEAVRARVVSEHSAVKRVLKDAPANRGMDWINAWTVAFECMITDIEDAFKGNALLLKMYQKLHTRAYRDIKKAMDSVLLRIDDDYVPTDSDGDEEDGANDEEDEPTNPKVETSDGKEYNGPANDYIRDLANRIYALIVPEFTLYGFWRVVHDVMDVFVSVVETVDIYTVLAKSGLTSHKNRVPRTIKDIVSESDVLKGPPAWTLQERAPTGWAVEDENENGRTEETTAVVYEVDGTLQSKHKMLDDDSIQRDTKRKRVDHHTQINSEDASQARGFADAVRQEHLKLMSDVKRLRDMEVNHGKSIFEYAYSPSDDGSSINKRIASFWPFAVETVAWWADQFDALKLVVAQDVVELQGGNDQCQLYAVLMAIYYESIKNNQTTIAYRKLFNDSLTFKEAFLNRPNSVVFALVDRLYNLASKMYKNPTLVNEWVTFHKQQICRLCGREILNGEHTDVRNFVRCLFKRHHNVEWSADSPQPERLIALLNDVVSGVVTFHERKYKLLGFDYLKTNGYLLGSNVSFGWSGTVCKYVLSEYDILKLFLWDISFDEANTKNLWVYCTVLSLVLIRSSSDHAKYYDETFFDNLHRKIGSQYKKNSDGLYPSFKSVERAIQTEVCDAMYRNKAKQSDMWEQRMIQEFENMRTEMCDLKNRYSFLMLLLLAVSCPFPKIGEVGAYGIPKKYDDYELVQKFVYCLKAESSSTIELIKAEQRKSVETGAIPFRQDSFDDEPSVTQTLRSFGIVDDDKTAEVPNK